MPKSLGRGERQRLLFVLASIVVLAYGWWFTDRQPFSRGALLALLIAIGVAMALAAARRERSPDTEIRPSRLRSAVVVWSAVSSAVVVWELIALRRLPRAAHPTISSLVDSTEHYHLARLGLYVVWIGLGWTVAT